MTLEPPSWGPQKPLPGDSMLPSVQPEPDWAEDDGDLQGQVHLLAKKFKELEKRLAAVESGSAVPLVEASAVPAGQFTTQLSRVVDIRSTNSSKSTTRYSKYAPGEEMILCDIGSTLWDASGLVGLPQMGGFSSSFFLSVGAAFNLLAQMYLTYTVLFSGSFITPELWEEMETSMGNWRLSEAHKYSSMDDSGVSLVARVCAQDSALSFANSQANLVQEINDYLGQASDDFREFTFGTGPMLSVVCVFMFSLVVLKELRHLATCIQAVASLPRGRTKVVDGYLVSFSLPRFVYLVFMQSLRACVALGLLYAGTMWLAYTSEITELILNAAALGFVMDLDELLFQTVVPAVAQKFVESIEPLRYKGSPLHWEAVIPLIMVVSVAAASAVGVLLPNVKHMSEVKRKLCGGRQDFVTQQNPAGYVVFLQTQAFSETTVRGIASSAVDELISLNHWDVATPTVFSRGTLTREVFVPWAERTILELGKTGWCHDLDKFQKGIVLSESPHWFMAIRDFTADRGIPTFDNGDGRPWKPFDCGEYSVQCGSVPLMRVLCPVTCGCGSATSSQVYNTPKGGCPLSCAAKIQKAAEESNECRDKDVGGTESWAAWWRNFAKGTGHIAPQASASPQYQAWIERKIAMGCNDTSRDPVSGGTMCDETEAFMQFAGFSTIRGFCPHLCCVAFGRAHVQCPTACSALGTP